jgi:hypothetical protein
MLMAISHRLFLPVLAGCAPALILAAEPKPEVISLLMVLKLLATTTLKVQHLAGRSLRNRT